MGDRRIANKDLVEKPEGKISFGTRRDGRQDNINMYREELGCELD